ncbi:MAG TPA: ABC transporter substrate-binding protein [Streptosporangiaceae bacterium]|jgi:NitT/TauT family transport system substrate-binding protein|nr:ABC transporter substrate-binding protein [Streptosporangiaceae bacterium]
MPRRFRLRRVAGLAVLVGLAALAAGCSGGGSAAPGGLEQTNLNVDAVPAVDSAGLYIAQQRGLFAAEGLHVSILTATSGKTAINGQLADQYAVTSGNYVSYILANADPQRVGLKKPADFRVLAPGSIMEANNQDIMVLPHSGITTVSDLKGKRIAVNVTQNIGQLLVSSILTDNAVPPGSVHFVPIPFQNMTKALQDHQVDAIWAPEPFITESEENAGAVPLADSNQGTTENLPISGYMVTASWLKKNPNTAAAFRRALVRAQAIAATDPAAIQQGMEAFAKVPAQAASIEAVPQFPIQSNAALLARLEALMLHFNMINQQYSVSQMISK